MITGVKLHTPLGKAVASLFSIDAAAVLSKEDVLTVLSEPEFYTQDDADLLVELDTNYNSSLGPLHEDYRERALPLEGFDGQHPLHIYVAAPVDLAISKLGRFTEKDKSDIEKLIECGRLDVNEFISLASEAIDYAVGNRSGMLSCLHDVVGPYLGNSNDPSPQV